MHGLMMDQPLLISDLIRHADRNHGDTEIVSKTVEGGIHRYTYREAHARAAAGQALQARHQPGGRPGRDPRLERLPALRALLRDLGHWRDHQYDQPALLPSRSSTSRTMPRTRRSFSTRRCCLVEKLAPQLDTVRHYVLLTDRAHMPKGWKFLRRAAGTAERRLPVALVRRAHRRRALLYLGDDGEPERRALPAPQHRHPCLRRCAARCARPVCARLRHAPVPMFHANAWSLPYACTLVGTKMVFPGPHLDGKSVYDLMEAERVTMSAGVPTVWLMLLNISPRANCASAA